MDSNSIFNGDFSGLTVEEVMDLGEEELDLLLKNIRSRVEKNRVNLEQNLEKCILS